jgi:hypothetical protein
MVIWRVGLFALLLVTITSSASARNLRDVLAPSPDAFVVPGVAPAIRPLGNAIASQVANQIPTLSTSAGYTYRWNPELEAIERSAMTFGPLFTERAVTVGGGKFNVSASYSYVKFDRFNGRNLDKLINHVEKAYIPETGTTEYLGLFRAFQDVDAPSVTRLAGDQVRIDLDLEAQLFDFSFTYGVLENLDVNVDLPVLRTYARSAVQETLPDPRCVGVNEDCDVALGTLGGDQGGFFVLPEVVARDAALGLGDVNLRAKWAPLREPVRLAGLLSLVLPTGDPGNFHGTGDTRLGTTLIGSKDLGSMFEIHSQGGVELNANDVGRSQARYAAGVTGQLASFMAVTVDFIGRSEFGAQVRIPNAGRLPAVRTIDGVPTLVQPLSELDDPNNFKGRPLFIDVKRNDVLDLAVSGRFSLGENAMLFANFLIPLNQDGLRADFVPTVGAEVNF